MEQILKDILLAVQPSRIDSDARHCIVNELQGLTESVESFRGATVHPFGSFVSDLFTRWGDLDISIEMTNGAFVYAAAKKRQQNLLEDVLRAIRAGGICRRARLVSQARVPIVKFESNHMNISCDLSINNLKGLMKSKILLFLSGLDLRFRKIVLLVKEWAKLHNINSSKDGSLTSYALTLLVVFHFQTCDPAIFPPLKEIYPGNMVDDLSGMRDAFTATIEETCKANVARFKPGRKNKSSVSDLLLSFFDKFVEIDTRALQQGIRTYTGQWEDIESNMTWQPRTYALLIEDPFEQPENAGRRVGAGHLQKMAEAMRVTRRTLVPGNSMSSLLTCLVGQHVLPFIPWAPYMQSLDFSTSMHHQRPLLPPPDFSTSMHHQRPPLPPLDFSASVHHHRPPPPPLDFSTSTHHRRSPSPPDFSTSTHRHRYPPPPPGFSTSMHHHHHHRSLLPLPDFSASVHHHRPPPPPPRPCRSLPPPPNRQHKNHHHHQQQQQVWRPRPITPPDA